MHDSLLFPEKHIVKLKVIFPPSWNSWCLNIVCIIFFLNIVSFKLMLIKTFFDKWIHIQAIAKECTESAEVISGIDSGWKKSITLII